MPQVTIKAVVGRTVEQKRGLVKDITAAVVKNLPCHFSIATTKDENGGA